jgi:hypothetical protein
MSKACHRGGLPEGRVYRLPVNWLESEQERVQRERIAAEKHLADLKKHQTPLISLQFRESLPWKIRDFALP